VRLAWDPSAWEDYTYWQAEDRRILKRINPLIDAFCHVSAIIAA